MEGKIPAFSDVNTIVSHINTKAHGVLDDEKCIDLLQTTINWMFTTGEGVQAALEKVDHVIDTWSAFTRGEMTIEELIGPEAYAEYEAATAIHKAKLH